jgi:hypothetical protein
MNAKEIAKETAKETVNEFKRLNLLKTNEHDPKWKTEQLLYNYPKFKKSLEIKLEKIEEIEQIGLRKKAKSITSFSGTGNGEFKSDLEKAEDKIEELKNSIQLTCMAIELVDEALNAIKDDKYFRIIALKYWERKTHEEIAEILEKEVSWITRNKNRLIGELKTELFPDDVIRDIFF